MRSYLFILIVCSLLSSFAWAATTGEHAADFLDVGVGARAIGMGGTFVAVSDDSTAAYWNPAGLTHIPAHGFSAMYADAFQQGSGSFFGQGLVSYSFTNYAMRLNGSDAMSVSWIRMGIDDIPRTAFEDTNGNGVSGDFLDTNDNGIKDPGEYYLDRPVIAEWFNNTDDALLVSYARHVLGRVSVGGTLKYIRQSLYQNQGTGWGVDIGLLASVIDGLTAAVVLQDATGTRIQWDTASEPTFTRKPTFRLGAAYQRDLPVIGHTVASVETRTGEADIDADGGAGWQLHYGLEQWLFNVVVLRVGSAQNQFTAGAGLQIPFGESRMRVDYAFSTHELGDSQRISLTGQF